MEDQSSQKKYRLRSAFVYALPLVWFIFLIILMNNTSPLAMGPVGILLVFVIFYLFICSTLYICTRIFLTIIGLFTKQTVLSPKRTYYFVSIVSLGPVFLVALNTLNQLGIQEVLLVSVLVGVTCFYVDRRTRHRATS